MMYGLCINFSFLIVFLLRFNMFVFIYVFVGILETFVNFV